MKLLCLHALAMTAPVVDSNRQIFLSGRTLCAARKGVAILVGLLFALPGWASFSGSTPAGAGVAWQRPIFELCWIASCGCDMQLFAYLGSSLVSIADSAGHVGPLCGSLVNTA